MSQPSITLKEFILEQGEDYEKWVIRIVLETYALALDVPLRLYYLPTLKQFWQKAEFIPEFKQCFPNQESFDENIKDILTLPLKDCVEQKILPLSKIKDLRNELRERYGDYLFVYHANTNPMLHMLNEDWWWRWINFSWYYREFVLQSESERRDTIVTKPWEFDEKKKSMHLSYVWVPCIKSFMVAGPIWIPLPNSTGEQFEKNRIKPFVESFLQATKVAQETAKYSQDRLIRIGNSRPPIGQLSLENRLQQASKALRGLFDMKVSDRNHLLYRYDYVRLAEWSLFTTISTSMMRGFNTSASGHEKMEIYRHIAHAAEAESEDKEPIWVKTILAKEYPSLQFNLLANPDKTLTPVEGTDTPICMAKEITQEQQSLLNALNKTASCFIAEMVIRRNASKHEFTLLLQEQFDDRFGILVSDNDDTEFMKKLRQIAKDVCRRILRVLQADIVTLYHYNYSEETLDTLGLYSNSHQKKLWEELEPDFMRKAGEDDEKRKQSICYRCIDTQEIRFCRVLDSTHPKLLAPPLPLETHRSGIAVPLSMHGRPWGVLEVLGNYPHQFRWSDRRFIEELGNVLSPFFYHQWFLMKLHQLNQFATDNLSEESQNNYHEICRCLAEIFLSYGADLWFFEEKRKGFVCKGWHNYPENTPVLKETVIKLENQGLINFTLNQWKESQKPYCQGKPSDFGLNQEWKDRPHNKPLIERGIKHFCCIPCAQDRNEPHPAFILLYNKVSNNYDDRWKSLITFVARYTALLFQAKRIQQDVERRNREFIAHELKTQAINIEDRTQSMDTFLKQEVLHWLEHEQHLRFSLLIEDLKIFTRDFKSTVALMKRENPGKFIISAGNAVIGLAAKLQQRQPPDTVNLLQQFNHVFHARQVTQREKHVTVKSTVDHNIFLLIHEKNLREILGNLCENAIKYARKHSTITAETALSEHGVELVISNWGTCLEEGEEYRIFENGFRGQDARENRTKGEGKGLFIVRGISELYGIGLNYENQPTPNSSECKHKFTLSFPPTMIRKKVKIL